MLDVCAELIASHVINCNSSIVNMFIQLLLTVTNLECIYTLRYFIIKVCFLLQQFYFINLKKAVTHIYVNLE
jgi:hypothetical protein